MDPALQDPVVRRMDRLRLFCRIMSGISVVLFVMQSFPFIHEHIWRMLRPAVVPNHARLLPNFVFDGIISIIRPTNPFVNRLFHTHLTALMDVPLYLPRLGVALVARIGQWWGYLATVPWSQHHTFRFVVEYNNAAQFLFDYTALGFALTVMEMKRSFIVWGFPKLGFWVGFAVMSWMLLGVMVMLALVSAFFVYLHAVVYNLFNHVQRHYFGDEIVNAPATDQRPIPIHFIIDAPPIASGTNSPIIDAPPIASVTSSPTIHGSPVASGTNSPTDGGISEVNPVVPETNPPTNDCICGVAVPDIDPLPVPGIHQTPRMRQRGRPTVNFDEAAALIEYERQFGG